MSGARTIILFDLDGVIVDSFDAAHAATKMICPLLTDEIHRKGFEENIHEWDMFSVVEHTPECRHDLDWDTIFIPKYRKMARPFAGALEILGDLASEHTLIIVSSSQDELIREFLTKHDVVRHFTEIMGSDVHTSKVEKMRMVLEKYGAVNDDCVFITDTLGDMREAKVHSIGVIGCAWGFHSRETLQKGIPFRICEHPSELPDAIDDYFAREQH